MTIIPHIEPEVDYEISDWATDPEAHKKLREEIARLHKIEKKNRADEYAAREPRKEIVSLREHISYYNDGYGGIEEVIEYTVERIVNFNE